MTKPNSKDITIRFKHSGLCGNGSGTNTQQVEICDGKIVRTRPLYYFDKYTEKDVNKWRLEVRGKVFEPKEKTLNAPYSYAYKKRVTSPNRIKFPLKRVDWHPEGERNPQNRGISKYVRISWDEATELIAKELKRVYAKYGATTVLAQCDGHGESKVVHAPHGCQTHLLNLLGGFTVQARQPDSWEGWYWGAKHIWGGDGTTLGQGRQQNLWIDIARHAKNLLFWGCDQETTPWGWGGQTASRLTYWYADLGIKQIYISPDLNYAAAVHADRWIPVKPNTDSALQLAIAYIWITEDTFEKDYVTSHVHGFDEFKKVVLGEDDGIPKTPAWAAEICGVPSRNIKALARRWAKETTSIVHGNGGSFIRSAFSHEPGRLEVCLLGMQGLGQPGKGQLKMLEWGFFGIDVANPGPASVISPSAGAAYSGAMLEPNGQFIPKTLVPKAILTNETLSWYGRVVASMPREDQFDRYQFPIEGGSRIHMIWSDSPCWTTCWNGGNSFIEALRSTEIECVVVQHPWMENDCLMADIILPTNTRYETEDIAADTQCGQYEMLVYEGQCVEPVGESKSDYEAVCEVAKKLGLYEQYTQGMSIEDKIILGFMNSGVETMISYDDWKDNQYFVVPIREGWEDRAPGYSEFANDPVNYPLPTPTGKLEFFSVGLAEHFPDDEERKPVPRWISHNERHQERTYLERGKKYPFLLVSNHPRWRIHANMDDITWLREIPTCKVKGPDGYLYEPVWINPVDAEKMDIHNGDVVKLYNERGGVLGGAYITERIMPGVVYQDHGARLDPIVQGELDRGGANNLICPTEVTSGNCVGEVTSGFLVGVEKVDLDALKAQYPDAFSRDYDPAYGLVFDSWIEGGNK
ncbi:molybdopterin-dependent oxidoreductase [Dehalobacter sp. DCM]|uniref:molybdopterin-dependent oxidoreductase n=1 Tax=Dehalobacter sp. DCM TaxID=2907827 RepID=UPI003081307E|nr:molybdopterin-dependent oxidoreductase [Dehalobacter sp. DCM]